MARLAGYGGQVYLPGTAHRRFESFLTGSNTGGFFGAIWAAQGFTPSVAHTIGSIRLKLYRSGSPGTITVSIRATAGGKPTGGDLCSGTTNGNTLTNDPLNPEWREITLGAGAALAAGTVYAIVARALTGDVDNSVIWIINNAGGYAGGVGSESSNSGVNWTSLGGPDYLFEEYSGYYVAPPAGLRAWAIDHVLETPEVTDFGSEGHKQVIAALDGWSGSFEGAKDGAPIALGTIEGKFDEQSDSGPWPSATKEWQGTIIVTARHAKVASDGLVEYSYEFVGNGALTQVPTT